MTLTDFEGPARPGRIVYATNPEQSCCLAVVLRQKIHGTADSRAEVWRASPHDSYAAQTQFPPSLVVKFSLRRNATTSTPPLNPTNTEEQELLAFQIACRMQTYAHLATPLAWAICPPGIDFTFMVVYLEYIPLTTLMRAEIWFDCNDPSHLNVLEAFMFLLFIAVLEFSAVTVPGAMVPGVDSLAHNDVKGPNILWDQYSGTLKLTDPGASCILRNGSRLGLFPLTPGYDAPERRQSLVIDASDSYSVGQTALGLVNAGRPMTPEQFATFIPLLVAAKPHLGILMENCITSVANRVTPRKAVSFLANNGMRHDKASQTLERFFAVKRQSLPHIPVEVIETASAPPLACPTEKRFERLARTAAENPFKRFSEHELLYQSDEPDIPIELMEYHPLERIVNISYLEASTTSASENHFHDQDESSRAENPNSVSVEASEDCNGTLERRFQVPTPKQEKTRDLAATSRIVGPFVNGAEDKSEDIADVPPPAKRPKLSAKTKLTTLSPGDLAIVSSQLWAKITAAWNRKTSRNVDWVRKSDEFQKRLDAFLRSQSDSFSVDKLTQGKAETRHIRECVSLFMSQLSELVQSPTADNLIRIINNIGTDC